MDRSPLVVGLAVVFAGMTTLLLIVAAVIQDVVLLFVALPFGVVTYVFWYRATGRIRTGIFERVRRGEPRRDARFGREVGGRRSPDGFGSGPRSRGDRATGGQRNRFGGGQPGGENVDMSASTRLSRREAYATLGLNVDADEEAVRRAYREQVKDVHPDRGGDEAAFRELTQAYEYLTD